MRIGSRPVSRAPREGVQMDEPLSHCVNRTPSCASLSMFGVCSDEFPWTARSPYPKSSTRKISTFGRATCFRFSGAEAPFSDLLASAFASEAAAAEAHRRAAAARTRRARRFISRDRKRMRDEQLGYADNPSGVADERRSRRNSYVLRTTRSLYAYRTRVNSE